jgi:arylsulfatase A-like enzyme
LQAIRGRYPIARKRAPAFSVVVLFLWWALGMARAAEVRPNLIYILADDLGWNDVGYHGSEIRTPHIDRLAAAGAKLEQFYVQPVCTPTRAALMTGRYPARLGMSLGVIKPGSIYGLPLEEKTLAQKLAEAGYTTAITGKWHLGNGSRPYLPTSRGFAHQYGFYLGATDYFTHERDGGLDWHRDDRALREEGHTTDLIAAEAVRIIERQPADKPLFLYVTFNAPHTPLQPKPEELARYASIEDKKRRPYAALVTHMDEAIGRIVDALEKRGLRKRTLIAFSSDNGGNLPAASNRPLRDQKGSVYEGGVRVPALAVWPGQISAGTVVNEPLHIVDWHATFLRLAEAKHMDPKHPLDGRDLWPAVRGEKRARPIHEEILINAAPGTGALRRGDWKLVVNGQLRFKDESPGPNFSWADLLKKSGLPAEDATRQKIELFNLAEDPNEARDLSTARPEVVRELQARYETYAQAMAPLLGGDEPENFKTPAVWGETEPGLTKSGR